ncbi:MAG: DNA translocase FtsK [Anaerolineae bacterium]
MAQQKPSERTSKSPDPVSKSNVERYQVKQEFWDKLFDSLPEWGDEIIAIVLIVFGIVSFLAIFNVSSEATLSNAWSKALYSLFGYGSVIVSGAILLFGIVLLLPKAGIVIHLPTRRLLALEVGFLSLLALFHLYAGDTELRAVARAGEGGGWIGWAMSIIIAGPFGTTVAIVLYGALLALSLAIALGVDRGHIRGWLRAGIDHLRSFGQANFKPHEKKVPEPPVVVAAAAPPPPAAPAGRAPLLMRIRPAAGSIPPSQRIPSAATPPPPAEPAAEIDDEDAPLTRPEFNSIGVLKIKKEKDGTQLVERPDGRIKRYYTVEGMKEPKRVGKRELPLPPLELLRDIDISLPDEQEINRNVVLIENTLLEFDIDIDVVDVKIGPTVTQYAVQPFREAQGESGETMVARTRVSKIASLSSDLTLSLSAKRLRIEAPVPGHTYVGIEVPNKNPSVVALRSIYESRYYERSGNRQRWWCRQDVTCPARLSRLTWREMPPLDCGHHRLRQIGVYRGAGHGAGAEQHPGCHQTGAA